MFAEKPLMKGVEFDTIGRSDANENFTGADLAAF